MTEPRLRRWFQLWLRLWRYPYESVIGDTVNLASRLEDINKVYGSSVILSVSLGGLRLIPVISGSCARSAPIASCCANAARQASLAWASPAENGGIQNAITPLPMYLSMKPL
jgi:hypothetical protein